MDERDLMRDLDSGAGSQRQKRLARGSRTNTAQALRQKRKKTALYGFIILLLWCGLVYGGYYYATKHLQETQLYFSNQVESLKQENQRIEEEIMVTMQLFQSELEKSNMEMLEVRTELYLIQEELELTGETITGSDQTRQSLQERIAELDEQLTALKNQLEKLEDAVRAF